MRKITIAMLGTWLMLATAGRAAEPSSYETIVINLIRRAIVKIDVSSTTPVFRENDRKEMVNICKSEGTGFLVNSNHVVTAEHVYQLAEECGPRNIVVKSKKQNLQKLADVVAAKDDVALLKVDSDFHAEMCALEPIKPDVYDAQAIRFGIPGGWDQPGPPTGVRIDQKDGQFSPLTLLAPTITEKGESGGPVIYLFYVAGLTRARHAQYLGFSFMTEASAIRSLMDANGVGPSGNTCNPFVVSQSTNFDPAPSSGSMSGSIFGKFASYLSPSFDSWTRPPLTGNVVASIKLDHQLTTQMSSFTPDVFNGFVKTFDDRALTVTPDFGGADVSIQGKFHSEQELTEVAAKAARMRDDISQHLRETLWNQYVAEGRKAGKWKDAVINPRAPATCGLSAC